MVDEASLSEKEYREVVADIYYYALERLENSTYGEKNMVDMVLEDAIEKHESETEKSSNPTTGGESKK